MYELKVKIDSNMFSKKFFVLSLMSTSENCDVEAVTKNTIFFPFRNVYIN